MSPKSPWSTMSSMPLMSPISPPCLSFSISLPHTPMPSPFFSIFISTSHSPTPNPTSNLYRLHFPHFLPHLTPIFLTSAISHILHLHHMSPFLPHGYHLTHLPCLLHAPHYYLFTPMSLISHPSPSCSLFSPLLLISHPCPPLPMSPTSPICLHLFTTFEKSFLRK